VSSLRKCLAASICSKRRRTKVILRRRRQKSSLGVYRQLSLSIFALSVFVVLQGSNLHAVSGMPQLISSDEMNSYRQAKPLVEWSDAELTRSMPELKGFEPAESQEALPFILRKVGENVGAFFHNFVNTASIEETHQVRMGSFGPVAGVNYMKMNYLFLAIPGQDGVRLQEYRTDTKGKMAKFSGEPSQFMLTSGFAYHSIYFHPKHQPGSVFRYLGRKMLKGRQTLVVVFAQRPEIGAVLERFRYGDKSVPLLVQGVAWIDSTNFEIIRLKTDLLAPLSSVYLEQATTDILFEEKRFTELHDPVWLPLEVNVTLKRGDSTFHNQHRYSDYRLFNVAAQEKHNEQKGGQRSR
jgi:hypothetical protein